MDESVESSSKRIKTNHDGCDFGMNNVYVEYENTLSEAFCERKSTKLENGAEVISDPFTCCILPDFIQAEEYLKDLKNELMKIDMQDRCNDLYQFKQSKDLGCSSSLHISNFKKILRNILQWMRKITNIPLTEKIDIFSSCYTFTDHLLCHDDELEGRRIAFIYYLVPEWSEEDGGCLDLFNTVDGQPSELCKTIVPKWNKFVFFEVSPISYHQVSEVLTTDKKRIALSGWFHGPPLKPSVPVKDIFLFTEPTEKEIDITEWVNPMYLNGETQLDIREAFEDSSEISLPDFLKADKYEEVCKALASKEIEWKKKGPPNRRIVYEANSDEKIPLILKKCQALFNSEAFFLILSNLTALRLHPMCEEGTNFGKVFSCIRKWCHGSYTLLNDQSFSQLSSLNAFMYFNCPEWDSEYGGYSSFVANEDNEELLRIDPSSNSLALAYVTEGTSHFVKYINSKSKKLATPAFHDIYCMYIENEENEE